MVDNARELFSLKMRASEERDGARRHVSGAEKIVPRDSLPEFAAALTERGINHAKGNADFLNIKMERLDPERVLYLDAPEVSTVEVGDWREGMREVERFLRELKIADVHGVMERLRETYAMRGATLLDVRTLARLEPDRERGIRATYMDREREGASAPTLEKDHYSEAIVLATKVMNCPGIVGEICVSDDPEYVVGYVASPKIGYRRITRMKEYGSELGGRIFLFDGEAADVNDAIEFLERQPVIVRGISAAPRKVRNRWERLEQTLDDLKKARLYRTTRTIESAQTSRVLLEGRETTLMASNNYLDLAAAPEMKRACAEALEIYGFGSGGSRLTTGNSDVHDELEEMIAKFKGCEAALVFNSGYVANLATISTLADRSSVVFSDELNHASIVDGCRLSRAQRVVYRHNDMADLESKIRANPCQNGLVVSDAVFSMDGDILKLPEFLSICERYGLFSMIDEAHSTGTLGRTGRGILEHFQETRKPDVLMGTLSKAIGAEGGFCAGSARLVDFLRNKARGFVFSTALSPVTARAAIAGFKMLEAEPERVSKLHANIEYFCHELREGGLQIYSQTPIVPIVVGDEEKATELSQRLLKDGFYIPAIRYPSVRMGAARLRVALMSSHTREDLSRAAKLICAYMKETR